MTNIAKIGRPPKKENREERRIRVSEANYRFLVLLGDGHPSDAVDSLIRLFKSQESDKTNGRQS